MDITWWCTSTSGPRIESKIAISDPKGVVIASQTLIHAEKQDRLQLLHFAILYLCYLGLVFVT